MDSAEAPITLTTPAQIRALVHPARLAVVTQLYDLDRALTATEAARVAGISPSAMSYHLRALEKAGIVRRAPDSHDGRERPWRRAGSSLSVQLPEGFDHASGAMTESLVALAFDQDRAAVAAALERRRRHGDTGRLEDVLTVIHETLIVTADEAKHLVGEIFELLAPLRATARPNPPEGAGTLAVSMTLVGDPPPGER